MVSVASILRLTFQLKQAQGSEDCLKLKIIIVGAGLSGIAASISCALSGHVVDVLESAKELAEVCTFDYHLIIINIHSR